MAQLADALGARWWVDRSGQTVAARRRNLWLRALCVWGLVVGASLSLALAASGAAGCDRWTGARSESWGAAANWTTGVPKASTAACISKNAQDPAVTVGGHAIARSVSLGANAQLTIASGGSLAVSHTVLVAGTLALGSSSALVRVPSLHVARTGTLSGVGAVHGNVVNAGTATVIDGASGVPLRVFGLYRQARGGTILFRDEGGTFTELRAGTASLSGGLNMLILDALTPGTRYRLVTANTLNGRFLRVAPGYVVRYKNGAATAVVTSQIQLSRSSVVPGTRITVSGASFGYGGIVEFHLDSATGASLGSSSPTSVGTFQGKATIPGNAALGRHLIVAVESPHGYTARAAFTVS